MTRQGILRENNCQHRGLYIDIITPKFYLKSTLVLEKHTFTMLFHTLLVVLLALAIHGFMPNSPTVGQQISTQQYSRPTKNAFRFCTNTEASNEQDLVSRPDALFPYGETDWKKIVENKWFCVDKTGFIPALERSGSYVKIWRPRRIGKSLLCEQLKYYYDMAVDEEEVSSYL
jgi:hypothetical protein